MTELAHVPAASTDVLDGNVADGYRPKIITLLSDVIDCLESGHSSEQVLKLQSETRIAHDQLDEAKAAFKAAKEVLPGELTAVSEADTRLREAVEFQWQAYEDLQQAERDGRSLDVVDDLEAKCARADRRVQSRENDFQQATASRQNADKRVGELRVSVNEKQALFEAAVAREANPPPMPEPQDVAMMNVICGLFERGLADDQLVVMSATLLSGMCGLDSLLKAKGEKQAEDKYLGRISQLEQEVTMLQQMLNKVRAQVR